MFPPLIGCADADAMKRLRRQHQERKLHTLRFWRDGLERQLAAINAAITTLQQQMESPDAP